jgi:thiosulfate/3-mercaptopyruvate sulfurtransferase
LLIVFVFSLTTTCFATDLGLIEAHALHRSISEWVVLDARPGSEWLAGHIPGALSFSWEDYTRTDEKGVPYRVWPPEKLAKALGNMGIDVNKPVVVYGDADKSWGGEGWTCWVLTWLGHKGPIRLLNGGIQAWRYNKSPLISGAEIIRRGSVQYNYQLNQQVGIATPEIEKQMGNIVLIDTRSTLEFLKGRIPGAIRIPWEDFFSGRERRPLAPDALKKLFQKHGIDIKKPIVYYCTGGIRSGYAWLVHQLSGLPKSRNYEGGFEAWKRLSQK